MAARRAIRPPDVPAIKDAVHEHRSVITRGAVSRAQADDNGQSLALALPAQLVRRRVQAAAKGRWHRPWIVEMDQTVGRLLRRIGATRGWGQASRASGRTNVPPAL